MVEDASSFWTDIQRYEDMLAADPRSRCFAPLSELYRKLRLLDDAVCVAKKGCDLHPDYPGGFFALGVAYYEQGLNAEARQALERVNTLTPDNFLAQKLLGQLYIEAGEIALAKRYLGQVLEQNPDDLESTLLLRSVASAAATARAYLPEESDDDIEELTEVLDEPDEEDEPEEPESAPGFAEAAAAAGQSGGYDPFEESEDIWDIESPEESAAPELPGSLELSGSLEPIERTGEEPEEVHAACAVAAAPAAGEEPGGPRATRNPLTTATLAELYLSQGFVGRALTIYQELLCADPESQPYRLRCAELAETLERQQEEGRGAAASSPAAPAASEPAPPTEIEDALGCWLENIRRRKDGV